MDRNFLKGMNAQKLEGSVESAGELKLLVKDGHHEVNGDRNPDLGLHRIGARTEVVFDAQVAFDPFEEEFDLPSRLVELGYGERRDLQVVGEEDEMLGRLCIEVAHSAQRVREVGYCFGKRRTPNLIAENPFQAIPRERPMTGKAKIAFGASDEEGACQNDTSKPSKVHVAAIHHIEGSRFEEQVVEQVKIGLAGSRDVDAGRDRASQIELGMHLDPGLGASEICPWEETQREIDGGGVEGINRVLQFQSKILSGVKDARLAHESFGEIFPESPVPLLVGIGQGGLGNSLSKAEMVESFASGVETGGYVAQSFPPGQLRKGHADQLLSATEMPNLALGIVALDQSGESLPVDQIEDLGKDVAAGVHGRRSSPRPSRSSNPSHPFWIASHSS